LTVFQNFNVQPSRDQVNYTEFLREVQDERVRRVVIDGLLIIGERDDGSRFDTVRPSVPDSGLMADLLENNVVVEGRWGFTEDDGSLEGRTPLAVRRACLLLVLRNLAPLADDASFEARSRWRLLEERTRDQSYRLDATKQPSRALTGDPEVDVLLAPYVRPSPLGAA
ncbi:MAG: ATP-dependent metallopeptidase FtsH/Yme1/Tma family protein, partial [Deltaproteobacteria bacterium]